MCGRYTNELEFSQLKLAFEAVDETFRPWTPTFNIAPSAGAGHEQLYVTLGNSGERALRLGRFWFIPAWWNKPLSNLPTLFNARAEELAQKKTWRPALASSRCLVPATGWREFVGNARRKQPYHFQLEQDAGPPGASSPFAFAGLSSAWRSPEGELVESFAIITTAPSEQAARYHDRMPLILSPELYPAWLDRKGDPTACLNQATEQATTRPLRIYPTSTAGNNTRFEDRSVIEPISAERVVAAPGPPAEATSHPTQLNLPLLRPEATKRS